MELKTYRYRERTLKQRHADSLVLSDSLGHHIRYIFNTNRFFFPGCTINSLVCKIRTGKIDVTLNINTLPLSLELMISDQKSSGNFIERK